MSAPSWRPGSDVNSNWTRHALNFSAGASRRRLGRVQREQLPGCLRRRHRPARHHAGRHRHRHPAVRPPARGSRRSGRQRHTTIGTSDRGNLTRYYRGLLDGQYRHNFARFFTRGRRRRPAVGLRRYRRPRAEPPRPQGVWRPCAARLSAVAAHRHLRPGQLQLARVRRGPDRSAASSRSGTIRAGGRRSAPTSTSPASCSARCPSATPSATTTATPIATPAASAATARLTWNVTPLTSIIATASSEILEIDGHLRGRHGRRQPPERGRARGAARAVAQRAAQRRPSTTPATTSRAPAGPTMSTAPAPASATCSTAI